MCNQLTSSQQVLPGHRRATRVVKPCLMANRAWSTQSVRPFVQVFFIWFISWQVAMCRGNIRVACGRRKQGSSLYVPVYRLEVSEVLTQSLPKVFGGEECVVGQTRLKLESRRIDIVYSGRGMPFRCRNIITKRPRWCAWEKGVLQRSSNRTF